ncbi:MAG: hypothetical protein LBF84_01210 [Holosporales bacterium]|jgi:hypothetical protein|nr:hypothetical protein [Holosporales bacterium]
MNSLIKFVCLALLLGCAGPDTVFSTDKHNSSHFWEYPESSILGPFPGGSDDVGRHDSFSFGGCPESGTPQAEYGALGAFPGFGILSPIDSTTDVAPPSASELSLVPPVVPFSRFGMLSPIDRPFVPELPLVPPVIPLVYPHKRHTKFTKADDDRLRALVGVYGTKNWSVIAAKMEKTRKQCRERWNLYLSPTVRNPPWTEEDVALLREKVKEFGTQWLVIARFFPGRTDMNVKNKWNLLQRICKSRRSRFTEEEDRRLMALVSRFGHDNWKAIASQMPGRSASQCRDHWSRILSTKVSEQHAAGAPVAEGAGAAPLPLREDPDEGPFGPFMLD